MFSNLQRSLQLRKNLAAVQHRVHTLGQNGLNAIVSHPQVRPPLVNATIADAIADGDVFLFPMTVETNEQGNEVCNCSTAQIAVESPLAITIATPTPTDLGRLALVATYPEEYATAPENWIGPPGSYLFIPDLDPAHLRLFEAGADVARIVRDAYQGKILQNPHLPAPGGQLGLAASSVSAHTREQHKNALSTLHLYDTIGRFNNVWSPGHDGPEAAPLLLFNMQAARNQLVQAQQQVDNGRIDSTIDRLSEAKATALLTGRWGGGGVSITDIHPPGRGKQPADPTVGDISGNIKYLAKILSLLHGPQLAAAVVALGELIFDEATPEDGRTFATIFDHFTNRARSPPSGGDPRRWVFDTLFKVSRTDPALMEFQYRSMSDRVSALQTQLKAPSQPYDRRGPAYQSFHPYSPGAGRGGPSAGGGRGPPMPARGGGGRTPSGRGHPGRGIGSPGRGGIPDTPNSLWMKKRPQWLPFTDKLICASVARNEECKNPSCPREHQYNPSYTKEQRSEMAAWVLQHPREV